jgi:hypothetical protein
MVSGELTGSIYHIWLAPHAIGAEASGTLPSGLSPLAKELEYD